MSDMSAYGGSVYVAQIDAPARPQLAVEIDVDACIIGAGLAGLTVARELARRGWSVAVLEARRIAWNASGRNTGFVLPGFAAEEDAIIERVGLDHITSRLLDDPDAVPAYAERFRFSQRFTQNDPWAKRVAGEDREQHAPMASFKPQVEEPA